MPVKFVPVIVTDVPPATGPTFGLTAVTVGAATKVNWSAGVLTTDVPPAVVSETMAALGWETVWIGKGNREDLTLPVLELRETAQRFGLLRKQRGHLVPTVAGRRLIDAMVDFPFALPTAVAGLTLASLFSANGWLGRYLVPIGIKGAFTPLGVVIALTFVGLPFVVRTLQPVLQNLEREVEEAAATLGAGRLRTFLFVIAPSLAPAALTGFALAFARGIGEYGSVVFISGSRPFKTEIAPQLIYFRLDSYDYTGAIAMAVVLLVFSFVLLGAINILEQWSSRFQSGHG